MLLKTEDFGPHNRNEELMETLLLGGADLEVTVISSRGRNRMRRRKRERSERVVVQQFTLLHRRMTGEDRFCTSLRRGDSCP